MVRRLVYVHVVLCTTASLAHAQSQTFGDVQVVRAMGELDLTRGDAQQAHQALETFIAGPDTGVLWDDAHFLAARAALRVGKPHRAIELLDGLENRMPEITDLVWHLRARAQRAAGKWRGARETWRAILAMPKAARTESARYGVADASFALGELRTAREDYEAAVNAARRSERAMTARFNLGRIAEMQGRWDDAAEYYRYIAYRYPSHPLNADADGRLQFLAGSGLGPVPSVSQLLYRVDRLLSARSIEEAEIALTNLQPHLRGSAERSAFAYRQAQLAYRQQNYSRASSMMKSLAAATSSQRRKLEYERWLARTYSAAGDYQKAIDVHLTIAARRDSASAAKEALFKGAWLAYNGGDHAQAIKLFSRFVDENGRDRSSQDALWYLGWNAYRLGDLPAAASTFSQIRKRFRTGSSAQRAAYWEGRIATQMGNTKAAREGYAAARSERPLSYYGALASRRLADLDALAGLHQDAPRVASLDNDYGDALQPDDDELPQLGSGMRPLRTVRVPWGASVFDWSSPEGKRSIRLMRLGLKGEAADMIRDMPSLAGRDATDVHYTRARLLFGLGDFNRAYRITGSAFKSALRGKPEGRARRYFQLAYPTAFWDLVSSAADEFKMSPLLILSLMRQESAFDDRARSWASANGLMQIIPRTGKKIASRLEETDYNFGVLRSPEMNVRFGAWYLDQLTEKFRGNVALAIGSYNAGPVAMARWVDMRSDSATDEFIEDIPYRETRHYVKKVLGNLAVYETLYGQGEISLAERVPSTYLDNVDF